MKNILLFNNSTPRWVIFGFDLLLSLCTLMLAYMLRFNFQVPDVEINTFIKVIPYVLLVRIISFLLFKSYTGIVRYTSLKDAQRVVGAIGAGTLLIGILNPFWYEIQGSYMVPYSILIIDAIAITLGMTSYRLIIKTLYLELRSSNQVATNVIVYGAGESGIITKRVLERDAGTKYKILAFVDDDTKKEGRKLEGISIYTSSELPRLLDENLTAHVIISIQHLAPTRKQEIIETCLMKGVKVLSVPPVNTWINGELSFKQIRKVKIEDLLEREPIRLDTEMIQNDLSGKTVLVTGAAGSIGSEIARQLIRFSPGQIILLDQGETPLHELEMELHESKRSNKLELVIGDVRNEERMRNVFRTFKPQIVFHAAAYKHVPMMENNPSEAILTNILGTRILADLAAEFKAEKFVLISTDKAVNPSSIMGATKRVAEIYTQSLSLSQKSSVKFITTRFGNVLGSNGSVIPRFKKQLEEGSYITVTHPEITRYFMTIPEACQLVLEAGALGKGGEIFIFDMGKSVKIVDLAKKMIQLSGLSLGKDIQLVYTGLRPGEKLYEELLNHQENTIATHHPKIMIAKVREYNFEEVKTTIDKLIELFYTQDNAAMVQLMKEIVPEFISNNSIYEQYDKPLTGNKA